MAHLLGAEKISLTFTGPPVLTEVSLGLADGDRIGIVGANGQGKSTLMALLAGRRQPDSGRVTRRADVAVGFLDQAQTLDRDLTVRQAVVGGQPEHVWAADARTREVMAALLAGLDLDATVGQLSGGQQRRVALAAVLLPDWDVLFLDEPTNHLDLEAITWLAGHLRQRWAASRGALVLVTHDRWFLDQVALNTWEVHGAKVRPFEGGYAAYILQRLERDRAAQVEQTRRRNLLRKELAWLQRGAPARTSKPKFRLDAAAALIEDVPPPRDSVQLSRLAMTRLGKDVVDLEGVSAGYGNQPVLRDVTWRIGPGDRLGLLGANGAGKTTLLKVVAAELEPSAGRVKRGKTVQVAWLSQSMAELEPLADQRILDLLDSLRASYQAGGRRAGSWTGGGRDSAPGWAAGSEEVTPTALLERLGLGAAQLSTPIRDLSGGQRRRLQLALTLMEEPNLLILDEPSNDLDTDMLTAVEDLLDSWPGTLLVVTHDRYLMERVTDQQFALVGGRLRHLPGGVDQYLGLVAAGAGSATGRAGAANATGTVGSAGTDTAADGGPAAAAKRAREAKKELAAVERRLERLRAAVEQVNQALAGVDPSDWEAVKQHTAELEDLAAQIDVQEERWLELGEQLT